MNLIGVFLKGFAMGAANVVPGVSGGTIAFITGIYERLINALKSCDLKAIKLLLSGRVRDFSRHVDLVFLAVLCGGVAASALTLAKLLEVGFEKYPVYIASLFFGLIAASVWSVAKMVGRWNLATLFSLLLGGAVAVSMAFLPQASESTSIGYLLLCGAVAMCSMIVPGVSGSFVLLLMGNYQLIIIHSVNKLRGGNLAESLPVLVPVGFGAIVGLLCLSHLLSWLFRKFHDVAVSAITGFVAGSLVIIWPWKRPAEVIIKDGEEKVMTYERFIPSCDTSFWVALSVMLTGIAVMVLVEKLGATKDQ